MARQALVVLAVAALALLCVPRADAQNGSSSAVPMPATVNGFATSKFMMVAQSDDDVSSIQAYPQPGGLTILFTLGPCVGLQPHTHNGTEMIQALTGNPLVGYSDTQQNWKQASLKAGTPINAAGGLIHYELNPSCKTVQFFGFFPKNPNASTQFTLMAVAAMPTLGQYAPNAFVPEPTSPFTVLSSCAAVCNL